MRVTFVHIRDQVQYDPTTAALAGVFKERMWMDWHVWTDFSTTKDGFIAQVRANEPLAVAFRSGSLCMPPAIRPRPRNVGSGSPVAR